MKNSKLVAVIAASVAALSLAVGINVSVKSRDMSIRENIEALASGEGGYCTGPKENRWIFWNVCACENDNDCSDNYNCQTIY